MIDGIYLESSKTNPYYNLALEEYLIKLCENQKKPILYLWQNDNTVVVGKNQNLFTECNMEYLRKMNILPSRRLTGGGAVFHDLGNLNYTIVTTKEMYNIDNNTNIIIDALKNLGLEVYKNGRNDICTPIGKISGNAYYSNELIGMQHGTILHHVNSEVLENVLHVPLEKLSKRGIKSVKSRVSDIVTQNDRISVADIMKSIKEVFIDRFCLEGIENGLLIDNYIFEPLLIKYSSIEWIEGKIKEYDYSKRLYCSWGELSLSLLMNGELISEIEINTDCMDTAFIENVRRELSRCVSRQKKRWIPKLFSDRKCVEEYNDMISDIETLLSEMLLENGIKYN